MNNRLVIRGILVPLLPLFFLFLLILLYPSEAGEIYRNNYIVDGFALLVVLLLIIIYISKNGFDMFEPIYFITIIYAVLYFVFLQHFRPTVCSTQPQARQDLLPPCIF